MNQIEFTVDKRGYNMRQVDDYIDMLSQKYTEVCRELQEEKAKHPDEVSQVSRIIIAANKFAGEITDEAKSTAEAMLREAQERVLAVQRVENEAKNGLIEIKTMLERALEDNSNGENT